MWWPAHAGRPQVGADASSVTAQPEKNNGAAHAAPFFYMYPMPNPYSLMPLQIVMISFVLSSRRLSVSVSYFFSSS